MSLARANKVKIIGDNGFLLNISGYILVTFQMALLAIPESTSNPRQGMLMKTPMNNNPVLPSSYYSLLCVYTMRSRVSVRSHGWDNL